MNKFTQMSSIRTKHTEPELRVRTLLCRHNVRYRLHRADLPGKPDIFISRLRLAIFVNGCFWHGHLCKRGALPKANSAFWEAKIASNATRDLKKYADLAARGIETLVFWSCD